MFQVKLLKYLKFDAMLYCSEPILNEFIMQQDITIFR